MLNKHDLLSEFPEHKETIHELKSKNSHFAKLFDEYHQVNKEVERIEDDIETVSDQYAEEVKKRRLSLKDELFQIISNAA